MGVSWGMKVKKGGEEATVEEVAYMGVKTGALEPIDCFTYCPLSTTFLWCDLGHRS